MSKRYGRNQKRAHREALASCQYALAAESAQRDLLTRRLGEAEYQLKDVSKALGNRFVGLPPVEAAYEAASIYGRDEFFMPVGDDVIHMHAMRVERVRRSDNPAHHVHFVAHIAGVRSNYILSEPALMDAPREFIVRNVAWQMARVLIDTLRDKEPRP